MNDIQSRPFPARITRFSPLARLSLPYSSMGTAECTMDRLPPETLGKILELCLRKEEFAKESYTYEYNATFCGVSRYWRDVAISNGKFWSKIIVSLAGIWPPIQLVELYIRRSGACPLDIWISQAHNILRGGPASEDMQTTYLQDVIRILGPQVQRWKLFRLTRLTMDLVPTLQTIRAIQFTHASLLEDVDLALYDGPDEEERFISSIGRAPAIRRLRWSSMDIYELIHPNFPWNRLDHLEFSLYLSWKDTMDLVTQCTSLVTLRMDSVLDHLSDGLGVTPYTFHSLRALHLESTTEAFSILPKFVCPQLEVLVLGIVQLGSEDSWMNLIPILQELNCSIQFLKINGPGMPNSLLPEIFSVPRLGGCPTFQITVGEDEEWNESIQDQLKSAVARHLPEKLASWKLHAGHTLRAGWIDVQSVRALQRRLEFEHVLICMEQQLTDDPI
ncbi:hypothetical protein NP233_g7794 [Leucocoprinus birnbaumii]|uniref:F-box domain-containing protein n=1 Tax=Leucocoprinus birnbaumii TaxID=56174 RepID=A0AAD5VNN4_9AGAR|nr:hypothetical protein NP233_g7794 [Leucocoprinus birnbaumii]